MANRIKTGDKPVSLVLNVVLLEYLDDLVRTGLYGNSYTAAVEALVRERVQQLIDDSTIDRRKGPLIDD